ncbi:PotD/PotF family extracellular solute-binding protein [Rickettsiales endosymbiont of Trichoplax sp. H2]|uniref:ABC transporter substrate-binding protein n=1 Tax=Rickettsiales endosymbiont of Trichoplax sp. H2 TaxID=2021221 RepID=UPI0012B40327|nr:spermidine/putrescine ABC transporter substrate-binding protein [Rickettsiales endosymbiont of Trichoplax sp. H2]MSO13394.1 Spermidine/putrescine-binding periplasmic protein 2 [Rickettsiales endosymbiont of Trichoplax sp. H2]
MIKFIITLILIFNINMAFANKLYIYGWFSSIPDRIINKFTKETGIKVFMSSYENNETMYAKLMLLGKQPSYDIVFPSTYFIKKMAKNNMLEELDKSKIPNFKNINKDVLNLDFDPKNKFSIPYVMWFTGIMYNPKFVDKKIDSWNDLFDPKYKKKVLLLDDVREVFHIALNLLGYDANTVDEKEIKNAYEKLKSVLPNISLFAAESTKQYYLSEDIVVGMSWNGDAYEAMLEDENLKFIYPKEGAIFSMDNFVILKNAKNKENAYQFINFICRTDIAKEIIEEIGLSIPNLAAKNLLDSKFKNNKAIFPSPEVIDKSIIHNDLGESIRLYIKYWNMLKVED